MMNNNYNYKNNRKYYDRILDVRISEPKKSDMGAPQNTMLQIPVSDGRLEGSPKKWN